MKKNIIELKNVCKTYRENTEFSSKVLQNINFTMEKGDFTSIVGVSGSGKTTLMNIIGLLDKPSSGKYILDSVDTSKSSERNLSKIRNEKIGFVFQNFYLISGLNAYKNIELPMIYAGIPKAERAERCQRLLEMVEMPDKALYFPNELSGGQKQRIAIARAMANNPSIILADEPTGALDSKTGRMVMDIFHKLNKNENKTILFITHNIQLAGETQKIYTMNDGYLTKE